MPMDKNFVQNKISAFWHENFYIAYLEVPNTNSKEILKKKKLSSILNKNTTSLYQPRIFSKIKYHSFCLKTCT